MIHNKIRTHKLVTEYVKKNNLDFTAKEIIHNIGLYGVLIDEVKVTNRLEWSLNESTVEILNWPSRKTGNFKKVRILEDLQDYLVLFKPVDVVVEAGAGHLKNNLINWLESNYSSLKEAKYIDTKTNFYLVNRLDKDTQGILLIAKNLDTQNFFQDQFRNRTVVKRYLAVVDNFVDRLWITTHYQSRSHLNPLKQKFFWNQKDALDFNKNSREALTEIRPLAYLNNNKQTLIEVTLKTGRMHQIRVLCENLGFPILNDKIYNVTIAPPKAALEMTQNLNHEIVSLNKSQTQLIVQKIFLDDNYLISNYLEITEPANLQKKYYQLFNPDKLLKLS
jgi:23S rRNA pseudouridine1911/1915/1917 synthase